MRGFLSQVENRRKAVVLSILCFSIYTVSYIGRLNFSAALTEMTATGGLSKAEGGLVATAYFLCYGVGQLINGALADRCKPVRQVTVGIVGSVVMNLLMLCTADYRVMLVIWGVNGYMQSLIWAPVFLIISQSIPLIWRSKSLLLLNTASPAGSVAAYAFSSFVLWKWSWHRVFSGAAVCMGIFAVLWVVGCRYSYQNAVQPEPLWKEASPAEGAETSGARGESLRRVLLFSGGLCLVLPAMVHGMLKDGITTWLPTYMTEVFSMPSQLAVASSIFLPVINMLGAVIAYLFMRYLKNAVISATILFFAAAVNLVLLWRWGSANPIFTVLLFSAVTASMMSANVLFCSEVPSRFAYMGRAATVSGFYNSCGYIGTAASMYAVAYISERYGWNVTQLLWIGACVGGALCCASAIPGWKKFLARRNMCR